MHMTKDDVPVAWSGARRTAEMAPGPTLAAPVRQPPGVSFILNLQRQVGNAAVARLLTRNQSVLRKACCTSCSTGGQCQEERGPRPAAPPSATIQRTIDDGHDLTSPRLAGDPELEACYDNEARLTKGMTGPAVTKVQQALLDLGYDLGPAGADGRYGQRTWNAVKRFKADQQLGWQEMGDVGPGTTARLDELFPPTGVGGTIEGNKEGPCPLQAEFGSQDASVVAEGAGIAPLGERMSFQEQVQVEGEVSCNYASGTLNYAIHDKSCLRPCTVIHEDVHKRDIGPCCAAAGRAYKSNPAEAARRYEAWFRVEDNFTEWRAFEAGLECVTRLRASQGTDDCKGHKNDLFQTQEEWKSRRDGHMNKATKLRELPCPFPK